MVPLTSISEDFTIDSHWPAMQSNSGEQRLEQLFGGNYRVRSPSAARKGQREVGRYNPRSPKMPHRRDAPNGVRGSPIRFRSLSQRFVCTSRTILQSQTNWRNVANSKLCLSMVAIVTPARCSIYSGSRLTRERRMDCVARYSIGHDRPQGD